MNGDLRVLYVAYSLLPVSDASAGGAEQILSVLERQLSARGYESVVAACSGSEVAGQLFDTGNAPEEADRFEQRDAEHNARIVEFIWREQRNRRSFNLIHDESGHFWKHASAIPVPVLATLHLPRHFYRTDLFEAAAPNLFFNCVSNSQARTFADLPQLMGVVQNGIDLTRFPVTDAKDDYVLWIGRICEEKGAHVAIDVAQSAAVPLVLAGQVYPFSYHQNYFTREILPRLQRAKTRVKFVQKPSFDEKVELLRRAKALLVPALVEETSSLVAMESMACGTPVIAFRRGALDEVVANGETGFVVEDAEAMAEAIRHVQQIRSERCRLRAESLYSADRMANDYEALYRRVLVASAPRLGNLQTVT